MAEETSFKVSEVPELSDLKKLFLDIKFSHQDQKDDEELHQSFSTLIQTLTEEIDSELNKELQKFIYDELVPGVVKRVLACQSKNKRFAAVLKDLLEAVCNHF